MMKLRLSTFIGIGDTFADAVLKSTEEVNAWLETHQWRGPNNEILYSFQHYTFAHPAGGFRHIISVYGPVNETATPNG